MCINRPKERSSGKKDNLSKLIKVGEKTNKSKYDFLRLFYTKWNQITKPHPRVIIDTHAGTGLVNLTIKSNLTKKRYSEEIYGSPLIAIIKTIKISKNLKIILNEANPDNYVYLRKYLDIVENEGLPIFERIKKKFPYKSLETGRKRKLHQSKKEYIFPESFNKKTPSGYKKILMFTKGTIIEYNKKIEDSINDIFSNYLDIIDEKINSKPIALFFVDPCGAVDWKNIIERICRRANRREGTELILNWSWEAINRTLKTESKNLMLSKIYGIPIERIDEEFKGLINIDDFLNKYKRQLKEYFDYVIEVGVPRDRKLKPKQSEHKKYFLILCTNNPSALSLAGYQIEKIGVQMREGIADMNTFIYLNNHRGN